MMVQLHVFYEFKRKIHIQIIPLKVIFMGM